MLPFQKVPYYFNSLQNDWKHWNIWIDQSKIASQTEILNACFRLQMKLRPPTLIREKETYPNENDRSS